MNAFGRYKSTPRVVYPEMKSKLPMFFVGFGAGLLVAFLAIGFGGRAFPGKRERTTLIFESTTNGTPVVMKREVR